MDKRYCVYEKPDLNSPLLWSGNNKSEGKKVRNRWKYQMLLIHISGALYDHKEQCWVP